MSVQYTDGSFSPTEPVEFAVEKFNKALNIGTARALYVGTENEIEQIKKKKALEDQIRELSSRLDKVEDGPVSSDSIVIPTRDEILKVARSRQSTDCGCSFENEHSNAITLCDDCSKLPCHNMAGKI